MSASSKCFECSGTAQTLWVFVARTSNKDQRSSKCTYVLNANSKGPGETAHLRKCAESSELLLLAHAIKTNVDCVSTSTE